MLRRACKLPIFIGAAEPYSFPYATLPLNLRLLSGVRRGYMKPRRFIRSSQACHVRSRPVRYDEVTTVDDKQFVWRFRYDSGTRKVFLCGRARTLGVIDPFAVQAANAVALATAGSRGLPRELHDTQIECV